MDTRGAQTSEYVLVLGLVGLVAYLGFQRFGSAIDGRATAQGVVVETLEAQEGDPQAGVGSEAQALVGAGKATTGDDDDDDGGGLWGSIKGAAGDVVDVAGDGLDLAGDVLEARSSFERSFGKGMLEGAGAMVTGTFHAVTHPVETVEGLNYARQHPFATTWQIGSDYVDAIADNPGEGLGTLTLDVLFTVGTGGTAGGAVKGSKAATRAHEIAGRAEEIDTIQSVAGAGNDARDGTPGVVKWADRWVAPSMLPGWGDPPWG